MGRLVPSPCACLPTPSWSPFAWPPATKKTHEPEALKGGSRHRSHPADRAGSEEAGPRDGHTQEPKTLPFGMVDVEEGAPGGGGPLPQGKPGSQTRREGYARQRGTARGGYDRARRGEAH
jgi:hypothetical protein